jgi:hypothetical protein
MRHAHMQGPFTTLGGASVSTFIGLWFGTVLLTLRTHRARLQAWATAAALLCELGYALALTGVVPINKNLCACSGSSLLHTRSCSGSHLLHTLEFSWLPSAHLPHSGCPLYTCPLLSPFCCATSCFGYLSLMSVSCMHAALTRASGSQLSAHVPSKSVVTLYHDDHMIMRRLLCMRGRYSASYVLVTAGLSGAFLCLVYLLTDVLHSKLCAQLAQPFLWLGLNAVLVYAGDEVLERALPWVYWGSRDAHLLAWVQGRFVAALGPGWRSNLALALADVAFWTAVAGYMHRKRWYVKV